jgi:hypothetical protein
MSYPMFAVVFLSATVIWLVAGHLFFVSSYHRQPLKAAPLVGPAHTRVGPDNYSPAMADTGMTAPAEALPPPRPRPRTV